jgi:uncharacterized protein YcbX
MKTSTLKNTLGMIALLLGAAVWASPAAARQASSEEAACLKAYHQTKDALAKDDLATARKSASDLATKAVAAKCSTTPNRAEELAKSDSLEKARCRPRGESDRGEMRDDAAARGGTGQDRFTRRSPRAIQGDQPGMHQDDGGSRGSVCLHLPDGEG